jgi:ketosteroid isomerase-like protein
MASLEERLERLESEREILRTLTAYGNSLDYGEEEDWVGCYLDDGVLHWPNPPWDGPFVGHDRLREAFRDHTHAPAIYHKHFVVDPRIEIEGDTARVESYFARLDVGDEGPYIRSYGRYRDVLRRCPDGRWRFQERRIEAEASSPRPRPGGPIGTEREA